MAQTIDHGQAVGCEPGPRPVWTDLDLALADARIVAELAQRIEIWTSSTSAGNENDAPQARHDLSEQTIRELLSVVDSLTRRESARRNRPT